MNGEIIRTPIEGCKYSVIDNNGEGSPCIVAKYPSGRTEIIATMTNTEYGHEHAEYLCDQLNAKYEEQSKKEAMR